MQPYLQYPGGKSRLAKKIVGKLPPHETYVEPMVGGGSVYFANPPATREVISDIDKSLMKFYRKLKSGAVERCDLTPNKRRFDRIRSKSRNGKMLEACEYLYLNKLSYGAKMGTTMDPGVWTKCKGKKARKCRVASKNHDKYADRLSKTRIEQGDFKKIIRKYDSKDTAFYLDPPYTVKTKDHYRYGDLKPEDVKKAVDKIKGKALISYNNSTDIKKIFCGKKSKYVCEKIETNYTINKKDRNYKPTTELLIRNYICKVTKGGKICKKI